jgi:hypothetical protein
VILVDDKFEIDHDNIMAMLKTVTNQPVKYVSTRITTPISAGQREAAGRRHARRRVRECTRAVVEGKQSGLPDITVQPRGALYLDGKTVEIYWLRRRAHRRRRGRLFPQYLRARGRRPLYARRGLAGDLVDLQRRRSANGVARNHRQRAQARLRHGRAGHGDVSKNGRSREVPRRARSVCGRSTTQMSKDGKSKADFEKVMRMSSAGMDFHVMMALDGLIEGGALTPVVTS